MDKLRTAVTQIAATVDERLPELPPFHKSFLPFVSLASWIYRLFLNIRRGLYFSAFLPCRRFPVPVISVGNLTWGGNGKTPMVEYIARYLHELGIPPLILSRGYAGGDEARMLQRHLSQTSAKIGVGANRIATADEMFERYGFMGSGSILHSENLLSPFKFGSHSRTEEIGTVILDDGMQHLSLFRNVEVVMINGMSPWGNNHLIPRGPLREPLDALSRAHIGVIHHADLVGDSNLFNSNIGHTEHHFYLNVSNAALKDIMLTVQKITSSVPIYFSMLSPLYLFEVKRPYAKLPLTTVINMVILCVSAIGFPDAFIRRIEEIGPSHVDRLDFSDHHSFKPNDITKIRESLRRLENRFGVKAFVLVTEKDYDRDPAILRGVDDLQIMVLCSSLQIMPLENRTEEDFRLNLKKLLFCRLNLN